MSTSGDYAMALLAESREELTRADQKAALLLASAGVAVGAVLAALLAQSWKPGSLGRYTEPLWWVGAGCAGIAIGFLAWAVYPRLKPSHSAGAVSFFVDVYRLREATATEFESALAAASQMNRAAAQLRSISTVLHAKYRCIQAAIWLFASSILACGAAVGVHAAR